MASKNNPANKKTSQKTNLVTSDICEKCSNKCDRGTTYVQNIKNGKSGKGVVCTK